MNRVSWAALGDLWRRYKDVFQVAWAERDTNAPETRLTHEAAFLPAHLELMETPVHPASHWTMRVIVILTLSVALVATFGKLDIVVVAQGQLIPDSNVKIVQPAITGVVHDIFVRDGQRVAAGQPLLALDARQAAADVSTAHADRLHAALATVRVKALLQSAATHQFVAPAPVPEASALDQQQAVDLAKQTWDAYIAKLQSAKDELNARRADLSSTQQQIAKIQATAPLARQQADIYRKLAMSQDVTQIDYLDRERTAEEQAHELKAQRSHALQLEATIHQQQADLSGIASEFLRDQQLELEKDAKDFVTYKDEEAKATTRQALMTLTAPVAGTVQQLAVHTKGGVVTTAQALLEIVPSDTLRVKATIENRDVGFVHVGQRVVVKVAAFPYTHYGYLTGTVTELANDAAHDKRRGSVFVVYIQLSSNKMHIDRQWVTLTPGMAVSAEITTGRRRVISYFLGPLIQHAQESLHER